MGLIAKILDSFTGNDGEPAAKVEIYKDDNATARVFNPPGMDARPLDGDACYIEDSQDTEGGKDALGFIDPLNQPISGKGENKVYARDAVGNIVASMHLKNDGKIQIDCDSDLVANVSGNAEVNCGIDLTANVSGKVQVDCDSDIIANAGGKADITAVTTINLDAATINLDANTNITASTAINIEAPTINLVGNVNISKLLTVEKDVISNNEANPISAINHPHIGNLGKPTSVPQYIGQSVPAVPATIVLESNLDTATNSKTIDGKQFLSHNHSQGPDSPSGDTQQNTSGVL